jgi:hypothetical protein
MAAATLPRPSATPPGPCEEKCGHGDCHLTRLMAGWRCGICHEPIGYDRGFYDVTPVSERTLVDDRIVTYTEAPELSDGTLDQRPEALMRLVHSACEPPHPGLGEHTPPDCAFCSEA